VPLVGAVPLAEAAPLVLLPEEVPSVPYSPSAKHSNSSNSK